MNVYAIHSYKRFCSTLFLQVLLFTRGCYFILFFYFFTFWYMKVLETFKSCLHHLFLCFSNTFYVNNPSKKKHHKSDFYQLKKYDCPSVVASFAQFVKIYKKKKLQCQWRAWYEIWDMMCEGINVKSVKKYCSPLVLASFCIIFKTIL